MEELKFVEYETLVDVVSRLQGVIDAYDQAAQKFIDKVDSGRARSIETYSDLKGCLELSRNR